MENTAINNQVKQLAATKDTNKIKAWWNSLSNAQKALAIAAIGGLTAGTAYYFAFIGTASATVVNGVVTKGAAITTTQALGGAALVTGVWTGAAYIVTKQVLDKRSMAENFEEAEHYTID